MASRSQFSVQHVARVPRGWRVRTKRVGRGHELRIAFPPGARRKGAGEVVEVLHPKGERNPCQLNPAELVIFGNPTKYTDADRRKMDRYAAKKEEIINRIHGQKGYPPPADEAERKHFQWLLSHTQRQIDRLARKMARAHSGNPRNGSGSYSEMLGLLRGAYEGYLRAGWTKSQAAKQALRESTAGSKVKQDFLSEVNMKNPRRRNQDDDEDAPNDPKGYAKRVRELEAEGLTTSDAQAVADAEFAKKLHRGNPGLYEAIHHGSRVTIVNRFGQQRTGKAVMLGPAGWVLNMGGPHGTPAIATPDNVTRVKNPRGSNATGGAPGHRPGCPCALCKNMRGAAANPSARDRGLSSERKAARRRVAIKRQLRSQGIRFSETEGQNLRSLRAKRRRNQESGGGEEMTQAVELYEAFQGKDADKVITREISDEMRHNYVALGKLMAVGTGECNVSADRLVKESAHLPRIDFEGDGVILACSPDGTQLYFIGGRQKLDTSALARLADDTHKDIFDLGECGWIVYEAAKAPDYETTNYVHKFGEESASAAVPRLIYDGIREQFSLAGGEYHVDAPGIIN